MRLTIWLEKLPDKIGLAVGGDAVQLLQDRYGGFDTGHYLLGGRRLRFQSTQFGLHLVPVRLDQF